MDACNSGKGEGIVSQMEFLVIAGIEGLGFGNTLVWNRKLPAFHSITFILFNPTLIVRPR